MKRPFLHLILLAAALFLGGCDRGGGAAVPLTGDVVEYGSGPSGQPLRGVLYLPQGRGPFPVLLYAHGSAPGLSNNAAFEAIAPVFTRRGWAVFAPYRRGQGLSSDAGPFIRDEIAAARSSGGADRAQARLAQLLATDHMEDQSLAFTWLARQPFASPRRIAIMGNSFGGIIALLGAERLPVCAAVDAAGGAESWNEAPALRALMAQSAARARAPVLFIQAENDFDLAPSRVLHAAMLRARRPAEIRIYPAFGNGPREGHSFPYKGAHIWADDLHSFLGHACR